MEMGSIMMVDSSEAMSKEKRVDTEDNSLFAFSWQKKLCIVTKNLPTHCE